MKLNIVTNHKINKNSDVPASSNNFFTRNPLSFSAVALARIEDCENIQISCYIKNMKEGRVGKEK